MLGIIIVSLMLLSLSAIRPIISVRAASSPTLSVYPSHLPLVSPGSNVTFSVVVSNVVPNINNPDGLGGWDIYVMADNRILYPIAFTLCNNATCNAPFSDRGGSNFIPVGTDAECINAVSPPSSAYDSCTGYDGPGIAHDTFTSSGSALGSLLLFNVTFKAVAGPYTFVGLVSPDSQSLLYDPLGNTISFTGVDADYGNLPPLPVASFTWTPQQPFEGEPVTFNATSSSAPTSQRLVDYKWTVIAQTSSVVQGNIPIYTKNDFAAGNWTVILVVKDDQGIPSRPVSHPINIGTRPKIDLSILSSQGGGFSVSPIDDILPGTIVVLKVLVINLGTVPVTRFNVSVNVVGKVLKAPPYTGVLDLRRQAIIKLTWNTTGLPPDSYVLHAHLDPLPNETIGSVVIADNTADKDAFATVRLIYPFQGTLIPFSFLQFLGLGLGTLVVIGISVSLLRRIWNRRTLAQRDLL